MVFSFRCPFDNDPNDTFFSRCVQKNVSFNRIPQIYSNARKYIINIQKRKKKTQTLQELAFHCFHFFSHCFFSSSSLSAVCICFIFLPKSIRCVRSWKVFLFLSFFSFLLGLFSHFSLWVSTDCELRFLRLKNAFSVRLFFLAIRLCMMMWPCRDNGEEKNGISHTYIMCVRTTKYIERNRCGEMTTSVNRK